MATPSRTVLLLAALIAGPAACVPAANDTGTTQAAASAEQASTPGGTGRTVVPGSNSTISGDAAASERQRTGQYGPSR